MSLPFSDEELLEPITNILNNEIRPIAKKDGGDINLVEIKNGSVYIKFGGACVGCSAKDTTLNKLVSEKLQLAIHPELKVVAVN
jgi:Fe-S cluster biogenesis protein NfuA